MQFVVIQQKRSDSLWNRKTLERLWCIFRHHVFAQLFCLFPSMHFCRCKCIRILCLMSMLEFVVEYSVYHIWGCWRSYLQSFGLGSFCHFCRTPSSKNAFQWKQCPRLDGEARMPENLCASFHFEAKVDFARQEVVVEVRMQAEMFALYTWSHKATVGCRLFFDVQAGELVYGPPDVWHVALALEEMGHDGTAAWYPALIEPRNTSDGRTRFAVANRWSTKVTFSALYRLAMDHGSQSQWPFTFVHQLTGWRAELWTILCLPGLPGAGPGRTWVPHGSHMGPTWVPAVACPHLALKAGKKHWPELMELHSASRYLLIFAHELHWWCWIWMTFSGFQCKPVNIFLSEECRWDGLTGVKMNCST